MIGWIFFCEIAALVSASLSQNIELYQKESFSMSLERNKAVV
jgi:hypothetical protein